MRRGLLLPALLLLVPACGQERVAVAEPDRPGQAVLALERDTGAVLWRKEIEPPDPATDPVLVGDVALVPGSDSLIAYDARGGQRLWTLEGYGTTVPQSVGGSVVLPTDGRVTAVDARSGRQLWQAEIARSARVFAGAGGVVVLDDRLPAPPYDTAPGAPDGPGEVRLLGLDDGRQRWGVEVPGPPAAAHAAPEGVAVAGLRGGVALLSTVDGTELWRAPSEPVSQVLVAADRVVARIGGALAGFTTTGGRPVWLLPAGAGGPSLEVVDGLLLDTDLGTASTVRRVSDGTVVQELLPDGDLALTRTGLVEAGPDYVKSEGWRWQVTTGNRPALWLDADDDVVVAVIGWGQPPTRD